MYIRQSSLVCVVTYTYVLLILLLAERTWSQEDHTLTVTALVRKSALGHFSLQLLGLMYCHPWSLLLDEINFKTNTLKENNKYQKQFQCERRDNTNCRHV